MASNDGYISRRTVDKSYRPRANLMSPGLQRAREPYRVRNALTGIAIAAFGVGVWAYSISAVKQDVFDDADEEARALRGAWLKSIEDEQAATVATASVSTPAIAETQLVLVERRQQRGLLVGSVLDKACPWLLDPEQKTLVWGAPPVDKIGRMADGRVSSRR